MSKAFLLVLILFSQFLSFGCQKKENATNPGLTSQQKEYVDFPSGKQVTFIFDFDDTIYNTTQETNSYISILHKNVFKRIQKDGLKKYSHCRDLEKNVMDFVKKNAYLTKTMQGKVDLIKLIKTKFKLKFTQDDINMTIAELRQVQTQNIDIIIKSLINSGYDVKIVGGDTYGCAVIPELVKDFGIKRENVYSGYSRTLQNNELNNIWIEEWRYANCEYLKDSTPYSDKKSDIINYIKKKYSINNKIVMIGDGENDLEALKNNTVDYFIGFGVNKVNKKVQEEASIFVRNTDDLILSIKNILSKSV